jgi:hypothetical protein
MEHYAMSRLPLDARGRVQAAQREELAVLASELTRDPAPSLVAAGGLPRAAQSQALLHAIDGQLRAA